MPTLLPYVEIKPSEPVQSVVIWLHGLGADGHDFVPIVPKLKLPASTMFIFPHAPHRPITINQNVEMPGWYDILEIVAYGKEDDQGILASDEQIQELISEMAKLVPYKQIYLVGFSQGGAMALYSGLTCNKTLGGIAVLSGYVPIRNTLSNNIHASNKHTPIFMAHGIQDTTVPYQFGEMSYQYLAGLELAIEWHSYNTAHNVGDHQINDIHDWFHQIGTHVSTITAEN